MRSYTVYAHATPSTGPGPAGWAFEIVRHGGTDAPTLRKQGTAQVAVPARESAATLIALQAALTALVGTARDGDRIRIAIDSCRIRRSLFWSLPRWERAGWKTSNGCPTAGREAWRETARCMQTLWRAGATIEPHAPDATADRARLRALAAQAEKERRGTDALL